jgi:hypothetical protein
MKNFFIVILIILIVLASVFLVNLTKQADKIQFRVASISLADKISITSLRTVRVKVDLQLENYSNKDFRISQLYTEFYTKDNKLLASQTLPLDSTEKLEQGKNLVIPIQFEASTPLLFNVAEEAGLMQVLGFLIGKDQLGEKVRMKGFVTIREFGLPLTKHFEEWITI